MASFTNLPLHRKLTAIIVSTTVVAIVLSSMATGAYEAVHFRSSLISELETTADIIAANGSAALRFNIARDAETTLATLGAKKHIINACFFTPDSEVFATYTAPGVSLGPGWTRAPVMLTKSAVEGYEFTSKHLTWVKHIYHDDDFIGSIHLVSGLDRFYDGLKKTLAATILIVLTCSTLALVVSLRVLRVIADPIESLIGTANRISQDQDYSLRAQKFADDDLGSLVDEFNDMLLLIQQRDEELEKRVNERTVELQESNTLLQDSLDEKVVLLKEVHHRVKNNLQIIASLLSLQSNQIDDEETLALFANSEHRVRAMATIHERLYLSQDLAKIDFGGYIEALVEGLIAGYKTSQNISLMTQVDDITLDLDQAIPCGLMINELVSNSLKYAFVDDRLGILEVRMSETADGYRLSVRDEGVGFPADIDFRKSPSLGLQLINTLTHQLGGNIDMKNEEGTEFIIEFPALRGNGEITPA